jgi:hypothetical protein
MAAKLFKRRLLVRQLDLDGVLAGSLGARLGVWHRRSLGSGARLVPIPRLFGVRPLAEGAADAERARSRGGGVIVCQLVVDIAAPVLRTRCCGGLFRPRREP